MPILGLTSPVGAARSWPLSSPWLCSWERPTPRRWVSSPHAIGRATSRRAGAGSDALGGRAEPGESDQHRHRRARARLGARSRELSPPLREQPDMRPEGDRIVILEDTNGDGTADKSTVFDQSPEIRAPLGIAVLGDRVIVSQSPNLIVYTKDARDRIVKQGGAAHRLGRRRSRPRAPRGGVRAGRPLLLQRRQRRLRRHRSVGHARARAGPGPDPGRRRGDVGRRRLLRRRRPWWSTRTAPVSRCSRRTSATRTSWRSTRSATSGRRTTTTTATRGRGRTT